MSVRQNILQRLANSRNAAVERVVEVALVAATPAQQAELAQVLLHRNRRAGWVALIRRFDQLAPDIQDRLLANPRELFGPLSDTMEHADGNARTNVIDIVRKAADPRMVFLLTEALSDGRNEVRQLAAESLLESVRRHLSARGEAHADAPNLDPQQLRRAIDFALKHYRAHRQGAVLLAALIFERQQDSLLWPHFQNPHDDLTRAAGNLLRQLPDPDLAAAVFLALASPLRAAALSGLSAAVAPHVVSRIASESFRLLDPALAAGAENLAHVRMLATIPAQPPWDGDSWIGYFRLVQHLPLPPHEKLAWYLALLNTLQHAAGAMGGRALLAQAIGGIYSPDAVAALVQLTADPAEPVARIAVRALISRRQADWRSHLNKIAQSPHESVRRMIAHAITPGQFDRLWTQYQKLPPAVAVNTTREMAREDDFAGQLTEKLASQDPTEVSKALRMLLGVPNLAAYRDQIIALCANPESRIVASAVRLLGRLEDPGLRDLLEAAARHRDPRVRANAIEAMEQLHVAHRSQQVLALMNSRHNRERANAIKAISQFDFATARECLLRMLNDPSPSHRVSAMWVIGQLGLLDIVRALGTTARRDTNPHARKRAKEMLDAVESAARMVTRP